MLNSMIFTINKEIITLDFIDGRLVAEGYDFENEQLAASVSNYYSPQTLFLLGAQALAQECKEEEFRKQYKSLGEIIPSERNRKELSFLIKATQRDFGIRIIQSLHWCNFTKVLLHSEDREVRLCLLRYNNANIAVIEALLNDPDEAVALRAVSHPHLPYKTLLSLASDQKTRAAAMVNPQAAKSLHQKYSQDADENVRLAIAQSSKNWKLLETFKNDTRIIKVQIARRDDIPREIRFHLALDADPLVAEKATHFMNTLELAVLSVLRTKHKFTSKLYKPKMPDKKTVALGEVNIVE